jgi:hypothetical protein
MNGAEQRPGLELLGKMGSPNIFDMLHDPEHLNKPIYLNEEQRDVYCIPQQIRIIGNLSCVLVEYVNEKPFNNKYVRTIYYLLITNNKEEKSHYSWYVDRHEALTEIDKSPELLWS